MTIPPTPPNAASNIPEIEPDEPPWNPCAKHILIAEDNGDMRCLLAESLRKDGYDVMEATDGFHLQDYVDYLRGTIVNGRFFDVDVIISDIRMPGASGLDVLKELRRYDSETPVILITGFSDPQTQLEARRAGASAVFLKPLDVDALRAFVKQLVPPTGEPDRHPMG